MNLPVLTDGDLLNYEMACKVLSIGQGKPQTIANYCQHIKHFLAFCQKDNSLKIDSLINFKTELDSHKDRPVSTKNQYLIVAKIYTAVLYHLKAIPIDISKDLAGRPIRLFKENRHKKDGFAADQIGRIDRFMSGLGQAWADRRLLAMLTLLRTQDLRSAELLNLDYEDIELNKKSAWILGKGRDDKERITLTDQSCKALAAWIEVSGIRSDTLFISYRRCRLSKAGFKKIIQTTLAGLKIDGSAHTFRHSYADTLLRSERYRGRYDHVRQCLRHKSLNMIIAYATGLNMAAEQPHLTALFEQAGAAA